MDDGALRRETERGRVMAARLADLAAETANIFDRLAEFHEAVATDPTHVFAGFASELAVLERRVASEERSHIARYEEIATGRGESSSREGATTGHRDPPRPLSAGTR